MVAQAWDSRWASDVQARGRTAYHQRMRFVLALGPLLLLAAAAFACDGDEPRMVAAPTATSEPATAVSPPFVVPTTTPVPILTILPPLELAGWAVFHRGTDLWVGKLDGSQERALTPGVLGSGFAGMAIDASGNRTIYFTALTEQNAGDPAVEGSVIDVHRQRLDGSSEAELITTIRIPREPTTLLSRLGIGMEVAVSPDGEHVAYTDNEGLWMFDIATSERRLRLAHQKCEFGDDISICKYYHEPSWSFDGTWLVLREGHYEGSIAVILQPGSTAPPLGSQVSNGAGGLWRTWSPIEPRLCVSASGYQDGGAGILQTDAAYRDLEILPSYETGRAALASNCAWSIRGEIAVAYRISAADTQAALILSSSLEMLSTVDLPFQHRLTAWLPDSTGFIVTYRAGEARPQSRILLLDGSLHELALPADDVIAVLPE